MPSLVNSDKKNYQYYPNSENREIGIMSHLIRQAYLLPQPDKDITRKQNYRPTKA